MEATNKKEVVASYKIAVLGGLLALAGVVVGAALVAHYSPAGLPVTAVHDTPKDPPVIMHGGSFYVYLQLNAEPAAGPPVTIDNNDVTTVSFSNYTAMGPAPAPPSHLVPPWEVDVCDTAPVSKLCQAPGIKISVGSNSVMTVDVLPGTKFSSLTVPPPPLNYYPYVLLAPDGSQIHPGYLVIKTGSTGSEINNYQCSALSSSGGITSNGAPSSSGSWANCVIQLGLYP